jgi:hypothetical protein
MTNKQIAEIIRRGQQDELDRLVDELDPPRPEPEPEPGTVVWWKKDGGYDIWLLGYVSDCQSGVVPLTGEPGFDDYCVTWDAIDYRPARILADDEVAVQVPDISGWPDDSEYVEVALIYDKHTRIRYVQHITRSEAEARDVK